MPVISARRLASNRANAKKSTGPRTSRGKHQVSQNAVTHGVFCNDLVLSGESQEAFEAMRNAMIDRLNPRDLVELLICDQIVAAAWKRRRLNTAEMANHVHTASNIARSRNRDVKKLKQMIEDGEDLEEMRADPEEDVPQELSADMDEMLLNPDKAPAGGILAVNLEHQSARFMRYSAYAQRLEHTIQRSLRELQTLRKMGRGKGADAWNRCGFVPDDYYAKNCESAISVCENKPNSPQKNEQFGFSKPPKPTVSEREENEVEHHGAD